MIEIIYIGGYFSNVWKNSNAVNEHIILADLEFPPEWESATPK